MSEAVRGCIRRRASAGNRLAAESPVLVAAAEALAERFRSGATLLAFGAGVGAADANHIAVEFVHPVVVGKPALPALSLVTDAATVTGVAQQCPDDMFVSSLRLLARSGDAALGISADGCAGAVSAALREARAAGLLTIAMVGGEAPFDAAVADHVIQAWSSDPQVVKEVHVTAYHLLWELVQVFLEQPPAPDGSTLSVTA